MIKSRRWCTSLKVRIEMDATNDRVQMDNGHFAATVQLPVGRHLPHECEWVGSVGDFLEPFYKCAGVINAVVCEIKKKFDAGNIFALKGVDVVVNVNEDTVATRTFPSPIRVTAHVFSSHAVDPRLVAGSEKLDRNGMVNFDISDFWEIGYKVGVGIEDRALMIMAEEETLDVVRKGGAVDEGVFSEIF
jgi:hypothetical protein